jgi:hypothetical protein
MAYTGNDPYEEARMKALIKELGVTVPIYPTNSRVKNIEDINPMRSYRESLEGEDGEKYLDLDSPKYLKALEDPSAPADIFSGLNDSFIDIPTSSTNVRRPRTVAAGYAPDRLGNGKGVLTVVFRDGTVWNYFGKGDSGVTLGEWLNFKNSISKGKPWINEKVFGYGAPADVSFIDPQVRAKVYQVAREYQLQSASVRRYRAPDQSKRTKARVQRVGKTAVKQAQAQFRGTNRKKSGTNPSTGGKNPNK